MRIWFDISNSPHVILFYDLINDLSSDGHEIIITSRPLANTIDLLNQYNLNHNIIGSHYGKNLIKKLFGYPVRVFQLYKYLHKKNINLAVSQSSFHSPFVAFLLRIPSIYTNDNEHAFANHFCFILASKILLPSSFSFSKQFYYSLFKEKIITYPGIKEGIYLWVKHENISKKRTLYFNTYNKCTIYVRPEPQTAQYYSGKLFFLDDLIISLQSKYQVIILTRNLSQFNHYNQSIFNKSIVPIKPIHFDEIAINCSLFIGAGGSMTRELAILGIPTISVYQDSLLEVDKLLIKSKLLIHEIDLDAIKVEDIIHNNITHCDTNSLLLNGKSAYDLFKSEILSYN